MRVLITGAAGQLGPDLVTVFERDGHHRVIAANRGTSTSPAATRARPDHREQARPHRASAAYTAVDACEADPDGPTRSTLGTRHVADGARRVGPPWSTCRPTTSSTAPRRALRRVGRPEPAVGLRASKLAGKHELDPGSTIVLTSWVCGFHGDNMVKTILRLAAEHDKLSFVDDQTGTPPSPGPRRRDQAAGGRATTRAVPRHQPGRGVVVRVRCEVLGRRPRPRAGQAHQHRRPRSAASRAASRQLGARQRRAALSGLPLLTYPRETLERLVIGLRLYSGCPEPDGSLLFWLGLMGRQSPRPQPERSCGGRT